MKIINFILCDIVHYFIVSFNKICEKFMLHFISYHPWILIIVGVVAVIDVILKLISLWRAALNNQLAWFICLGVINTAGILPLIYILFFSKKPIVAG
jgi:hypothetical protein